MKNEDLCNASDEGSVSNAKLLFFAGASNIQSISTAETRIYDNGDLYTNRLYADGGFFGNITIDVDTNPKIGTYMKSEKTDSYGYEYTWRQTFEMFQFKSKRESYGSDNYQLEELVISPLVNSDIYDSNALLSLNAEGIPMGHALLSISQIRDYPAIDLLGGYISGFKMNVRTVTSSSIANDRHLLPSDNIILVDSNNSLSLYLPDNPEIGHFVEFAFVKPNGNTLTHTVYSQGSILIHDSFNDNWNKTSLILSAVGIGRFLCMLDANGKKYWWYYRLL